MKTSILNRAAKVISEAEAFVITAGAGMGVDSGLPDYRGNFGFWKEYPLYYQLGLSYIDCADPRNFVDDPAFGWGFCGHCTNLYRDTIPHDGFHIIKKWIERNNANYFVVTSNVDGQFQKAGYNEEQILEVHGSFHWLQCQTPCNTDIWQNKEIFSIDETTMRARPPLPHCPRCGDNSRPNVLMFRDLDWLPDRTRCQEQAFDRFMLNVTGLRIVVIELGAGKTIPTIRRISERIGWEHIEHATIIRINPHNAEIEIPHISLPCTALEGVSNIDKLLKLG